jgi:fluoroquinolone resistance protein
MPTYIDDQTFKNIDYTIDGFEKADFENCNFINCNFQSLDLGGIKFTDCTFLECNLSMTKTVQTSFTDVSFTTCKMVGMWFDTCNTATLKLGFEGCQLNHTSFARLKLKSTAFKNCNLYECDFSDADLSNSLFDLCDLTRTIFENTILEAANFTTSFGFSINPNFNKLKKTKFSKNNISGLLSHLDIVMVD